MRRPTRSDVRRRFVSFYMGRIAGRYCPCEWPIKSRRLMRLCGRIDDANERLNFRDFCGFWLNEHNTTSSTTVATITMRRFPHNERGPSDSDAEGPT